ncbi:MAG: DNA repair protein RecO [Lachnospiraceae bacterium]|nr:DNA repair protein RecO [Lachnospiraceae bacterium]
MRETIEATGFVLRADPDSEYNKRLTVLTAQLGKITVFARGVRRQGSQYMAACNTFAYGTFSLYEGRSAYTLAGVSDVISFDAIAKLYPGAYYCYYFLELASFYGQENLEASDMVKLLFVTLRAVLREKIPISLIKAVYECRMLSINGDIAMPEEGTVDPAAHYALDFAMHASYAKLYSFNLSEKAMKDFTGFISKRLTEITGDRFRTLFVLRTIDGDL